MASDWGVDDAESMVDARLVDRTRIRVRRIRRLAVLAVVMAILIGFLGLIFWAQIGHPGYTSTSSSTLSLSAVLPTDGTGPGQVPTTAASPRTTAPVTLALGQPAQVQAVTGDGTPVTYASITVTPTAVTQPATMAGAGDVNATVTLQVCAGPQAVTPAELFPGALSVITTPGTTFGSLGVDTTSAPLSVELQPGQCATGVQGFDVTGGAKITQVTFGGSLEPRQTAWNA